MKSRDGWLSVLAVGIARKTMYDAWITQYVCICLLPVAVLSNQSNTFCASLATIMPPKAAGMQLTPFLRGVVYGMFLAGMTYANIAEEVQKPDGSQMTEGGARYVVAKVEKEGGLASIGAAPADDGRGRPRATDNGLDKAIVKLVFKMRGKAVVTVNYLKKVLKPARKLSRFTLARRLKNAGMAWLRRRRKSIVPSMYKEARLEWASWVLRRTMTTLSRWAFSDGTVFYLARDPAEVEDKGRLALGPHVWRMADGSDGLFEDCVGASSYAKAQGLPVRVWGLLVAGYLFITVLPSGETMNQWWYAHIIRMKFATWVEKALGGKGAFLLQDHEKALWTDESRKAMAEVGLQLLENFPKCSQDLNAIENAWRELRARLAATQPDGPMVESRDAFVVRLRAAVAWVNRNRSDYLEKICSDQKERARAVMEQQGARTRY